MSGGFFWYDVMTTDVKSAAAFYSAVVGWGTRDASTGGTDYTLFTLDGEGVAGLMPVPEEAARQGAVPAWLGYVAVDDVDAAAARLQEHGGTVLRRPETVPDTIRFAVVADPQGAAFYIAKGLAARAPSTPPMGTPGTIGWNELMAGDGEKALAFYAAMFGWSRTERIDMGGMGFYDLFATGGPAVGGMMTKPPTMPQPFWGFYFNVPAIDAAAERVRTAGGTVRMGPTQVPGDMWVVQCADPQGAAFGLVAPAR